MADGDLVIPQGGFIRSLNIPVACAVTLYEAFRQKSRAGHYAHCQLNEESFRDLLSKWGIEEKE
jgi:tRNA (guanosine-2'-O-)-methyltransferase